MTSQRRLKLAVAGVILAGLGFTSVPTFAWQQRPLTADAPAASHRTRLILKDGSYQIVMSYRVVGNVVHYVSAERGGVEEEIPLALVDMEATKRYEAKRAAETGGGQQEGQPAAIDPELLKEEAERASLTPEVAPDLHLPDDDSALALDTFHGTQELVPLTQSQGELNHSTGHSIVRAPVNPASSAHMITQVKGESSPVQMHVNDPVFYLRVGEVTAPPSSQAMTVDTHGASSKIPDATIASTTSRYVVVRADVRVGARVVDSFKIGLLGSGRTQPDVIEMKAELLPGGHWMKLTPQESLEFGEYALMEVLTDRDVNIGVWDFGIHPVAAENRDVIKPQTKRPFGLEKRSSQN